MQQRESVNLLDHGSIQLIESWGSDEFIICAARMSTDKGFLGWGPLECPVCRDDHSSDSHQGPNCKDAPPILGDEKLLRYLWVNKHATPFEMAGVVIEVKAPIFVFREWHRHRTQSYNEMSARYVPLPDENYVPSVERLMINSKTNKQVGKAKGAEELTEDEAEGFRTRLRASYAHTQSVYEDALKVGVPKELARVHLPVGRYSKMRASANLRNWLAFLTLRMDEKAQYEIQQYARALATILREIFPRTMELFDASHIQRN